MDKELVKRSSKMLLGIGAGAALAAVCPPAAIALGLIGFVRGARRFAQNASPDAAREMFMGYPWFWNWDEKTVDFMGTGREPDGNRHNDCHYTNKVKQAARDAAKKQT